MQKGRIKRNKFSFSLAIIITVACIIFKISPSKLENYISLISGILSFSSMATGFLFASFSLIPTLPDSKLIMALKQLKTDKKLLDRLLITIIGFTLVSVFAILSLFLNSVSDSCISIFILSLMFGTFAFSISNLFKVLKILVKALEKF